MTERQLAILNALVTFAAENIPGGLGEDEREVAQIVGEWVLVGPGETLATKRFVYKFVNWTHDDSVQACADKYAERGWRVISLSEYSLVLERPVGVTHPDD